MAWGGGCFSPLSTSSCPIGTILSHRRVPPDVHDQPSAVFSVVHRLHVHHRGLNSRLIIVGLQFDPDPERKRSKVGILENFLKRLLVLLF